MASDSTILTDILSPAADIDHDVARRAADAAIAAGWRPPARVIETAEELDALPVGAVVRTSEGRIAEKVAKWNRQHDEWAVPREEFSCGSDELDDLPADVLWEPEQEARR
ncbi:hypothetical protein GV791_14775 [Nocardia cyriacigeorgica]|uniref:Uncharacterized protein n=1 Tax=Nocardia cyriacigeorgica TaxID=135487 RepID=A0A6P1CML0_9NOCA|nr:hypothetical protein [Nocardia cyriacigeorgica]NEW33819.1 hypothetical protein [Nocardia cyriacigeorgica]